MLQPWAMRRASMALWGLIGAGVWQDLKPCHGAVQVLQRARGVEDVSVELDDIVEAARQSRLIKNPYKSIMQRKYRPQLVIAVIFMIFQQFDVSARALLPQLPYQLQRNDADAWQLVLPLHDLLSLCVVKAHAPAQSLFYLQDMPAADA